MSKESALHEILFRDRDKSLEVSKLQIEALMAEVRKNAQLEMLNWFMKVCSSSLNLANARRQAAIRFDEVLYDKKTPLK